MRRIGVLSFAVWLVFAGCAASGGGEAEDDFIGTLDATGTWTGRYQLNSVDISGSFNVKAVQSAGAVTGTITIYKIDMEDAVLTGSVSGNSISFGDIEGIVSFSGKAAVDDTASGTFTMKYLESSYSGTWTGICIRDLILQKTIVLPEELAMSSHHGLAWDGSGFWVSDSQLLAKVGSDGAPIASHYYNYIEWPLRDFDSLCWDGSVLWAVEDPTQEDYSKAQFCRIDTTSGEVMSSIPCPPDGSSPSLSPFGLGLAYDGTAMYCLRNSNDGTQLIYKIDRSTGAVLGTLPAPESVYDGTAMPGGFGAAGTDLYFSDRSGYLYKLRSSDGKVMRRFTYTDWSMGGSPGGVAWDGTCLWVRDTMEGRLNGFSVPTGLVP